MESVGDNNKAKPGEGKVCSDVYHLPIMDEYQSDVDLPL